MIRKRLIVFATTSALVATGIVPPSVLRADAPVTTRAAASPASQAQAAIDNALAFLQKNQNDDGDWQGPNDPPGISAIVLKAFVQEPGHSYKEPFIAKGFKALVGYQNADGSVSNSLVTYNTAITISTMAAANDPDLKIPMSKAVDYLRSTQWTDQVQGVTDKDPKFGGWGYGKNSRPDLSNVQTALDALHDAGLKSSDPAYVAALKFVNRTQNHSETNDQPWAGNDGGFIYTDANGGASSAGTFVTPDGKKEFRSYGSMTYAGLKSMLYAGLTKDDPRVKAAWAWIGKNWTLDQNPGLSHPNGRSGDSGLFYYYHTLARALRAYGDPVIIDSAGNKHDWRLELIRKLAGTQNADGSWTGTQKWMENRPVLSTTFGVLAMQEALQDLKQHSATQP